MTQHFFEKNKAAWNTRTEHHVASAFYNLEAFMAGKNSLNAIELKLLGDVSRKKILHLQCHFGQDSLSLARMGAMVTGVDFSDKAIDKASELSHSLELPATFICCNIYDLPELLEDDFDIVFTSYGTIGWFPDLDKWASIIHRYLKPGGRFVFAEFHPVVWMYDNAFTKIEYPYFKSDPIIEIENGTYADTAAPIKTEMITWNHSLAEVMTSLLNQSLRIIFFEEFDHSPYNCFSGMEETDPGKYRISIFGDKIPLVYAIVAEKKSG